MARIAQRLFDKKAPVAEFRGFELDVGDGELKC
jgi:hypothetical protein